MTKPNNPQNFGIIILVAVAILVVVATLFIPNSASAVTYVDGPITIDTTWTLANSPYVVVEEVIVNSGVTLTIEPGVVVKFNYEAELAVDGTLRANGSLLQKIYFTSIADDEVGGDTNGDGGETVPLPEDWRHIIFRNGSVGFLKGAVVRYGGFCDFQPVTGIYNDGGNLNISQTQLAFNGIDGIVQVAGSIVLDNSEITDHDIGIVIEGGTISLFYNSIHNNSYLGMANYSDIEINAENNWWGHALGPYHPILNPGGLGNAVSDGIDFIPWLTKDPREEPQNQPPQVSNLGQFKSDGISEISEGRITTENTVVFKAVVSDPDNDQVKLQIEVKEFGQAFDETDLLESNFVASGGEVVITKNDLPDATYHWRSRAVDDQGGTSEWQEFGEIGNVDFEVKTVPLYTQVESNYPPRLPEDEWAYLPYAQGKKYSCGSLIKQCGCAITSVVMVARYYDITEAQGKDVNPKEINNWLKNEPGGYKNGALNWEAAAKYTGNRIKVEKLVDVKDDYNLLAEYLNKNQPVIAKEARGRGGLPHDHFIVIDNKLATTYGVKDPAWYNTKTLNEVTDNSNHIRGYENGFDGLRIYKKGDEITRPSMTFGLGSPAELLITDPQGRKVGKDQNGIEYNEIPNAFYFEENYDDPTGEEPPSEDKNKSLYILEPLKGEYKLNVIGTGNGSYSLYSSFYDNRGNPLAKEFHSEITAGQIVQYSIFFDPLDVNNNRTEILEQMKSFDVKKMTIFWGFDCPELEKELEEIENLKKGMLKLKKKLPKHCFKKKNTFTLWGNFELPGNYQKDDLDKVVVLDLKFGDKQAKDKVNLKEQNKLWLYQEKFHQDDSLRQGIDIKTAIIRWSLERKLCKKWNRLCQKKDQNENWFYIRGELSLDGVDIDTQPRQTEVSIKIPLISNEIEGYIFGKDIIEFKKLKHLWFYFEPPFKKSWGIRGLFKKIIR